MRPYEVASTFGVSVSILRSLRRRGVGPAYLKTGRGNAAVLYRSDDIISWLGASWQETLVACHRSEFTSPPPVGSLAPAGGDSCAFGEELTRIAAVLAAYGAIQQDLLESMVRHEQYQKWIDEQLDRQYENGLQTDREAEPEQAHEER